MEHSDQDWTPVVLRRRVSAKEAERNGSTIAKTRDAGTEERIRLAKLENADDVIVPKKRVLAESIQALIRKRIELGLTQEQADQKCSFSKHTFKNLESHRALPTAAQQAVLQRAPFAIQLKIAQTTSS
jgi:hypothetical protein